MKSFRESMNSVVKRTLKQMNPELSEFSLNGLFASYVMHHPEGCPYRFSQSAREFSRNVGARIFLEQITALPEYFMHNGSQNEHEVACAIRDAVCEIDELKNDIQPTHLFFSGSTGDRRVLQVGFAVPEIAFVVRDRVPYSFSRDVVFAGVLVQVETGERVNMVSVFNRMFRIVCSNGSIREGRNRREYVHDSVCRGEITDAIIDVFRNDRILADTVNEMRIAGRTPVEDPVLFLQSIFHEHSVNLPRFVAILNSFIVKADHTVWGMANAITAQAQCEQDVRMKTNLEIIGGGVLRSVGQTGPVNPFARHPSFEKQTRTYTEMIDRFIKTGRM